MVDNASPLPTATSSDLAKGLQRWCQQGASRHGDDAGGDDRLSAVAATEHHVRFIALPSKGTFRDRAACQRIDSTQARVHRWVCSISTVGVGVHRDLGPLLCAGPAHFYLQGGPVSIPIGRAHLGAGLDQIHLQGGPIPTCKAEPRPVAGRARFGPQPASSISVRGGPIPFPGRARVSLWRTARQANCPCPERARLHVQGGPRSVSKQERPAKERPASISWG